ncbi:MAG: MerR family transcriptional regulator [Ktedonobacteraceae bacterium]
MSEHPLLKIGEFARIGQVSIATLHHYDHYGLLKPNALDLDTGYRYYSLDQLARLNRILALKELGFPLEQIARLMDADLSLEQMRGMFTLKQAQIQQVIATEQARLAHIAARLRQIEQEGIMPTYDVLLKQVDPLLVASVRERIPSISEQDRLYETLFAYLNQQGVQFSQPALLLLHSRHEARDDGMSIDVEVAQPLPTSLPANEHVSIRTLPGGRMASIVHTGDALSLGHAYAALHRWMKDNNYQLIDVPRLVHLLHAEHMEPSQHITEIQFPVRR